MPWSKKWRYYIADHAFTSGGEKDGKNEARRSRGVGPPSCGTNPLALVRGPRQPNAGSTLNPPRHPRHFGRPKTSYDRDGCRICSSRRGGHACNRPALTGIWRRSPNTGWFGNLHWIRRLPPRVEQSGCSQRQAARESSCRTHLLMRRYLSCRTHWDSRRITRN